MSEQEVREPAGIASAREIWKFPLSGIYSALNYQSVTMPEDAQILTAQFQDGVLCLWALVDPTRHKTQRKVWVYGTGWKLPEKPGTYIATAQEDEDGYVWHVFEGERR